MDPLTLAAILGGTGLLKSIGPDKWKEDRQRELASQTQRYSPWTHLQAGDIQEADPLSATIQGGVQGAALGQNYQNNEAAKSYLNRQAGLGTQPIDEYNAAHEGIPTTEAAKRLESAKNLPMYGQKNPWANVMSGNWDPSKGNYYGG